MNYYQYNFNTQVLYGYELISLFSDLILTNNNRIISYLLNKKDGNKVNYRYRSDFQVDSCVHLPCYLNKIESLKCCFQNNIDLEMDNHRGYTPLDICICNGFINCAKYLISCGCIISHDIIFKLLQRENEHKLNLLKSIIFLHQNNVNFKYINNYSNDDPIFTSYMDLKLNSNKLKKIMSEFDLENPNKLVIPFQPNRKYYRYVEEIDIIGN